MARKQGAAVTIWTHSQQQQIKAGQLILEKLLELLLIFSSRVFSVLCNGICLIDGINVFLRNLRDVIKEGFLDFQIVRVGIVVRDTAFVSPKDVPLAKVDILVVG